MKKSIIGLFLISIFLLTSGAICSGSGKMPDKVKLQYWSAEHNEEDINGIIKKFEVAYPYVDIEFKNYTYDEYQDLLIKSWAQGQGPDIFSVPNTQINEYYDLITPLPSTVTLTTVAEKSTLGKKELVIKEETQRTLSIPEMQNQFVDAVAQDIVFSYQGPKEKISSDRIYGIPLSTDNLALYWNKDLLNDASLPLPPTDWQTLVDHTKELTKIDKDGKIFRSAISLGTANNISNYYEILSVLMEQFGATMAGNNYGSVSFEQAIKDTKIFPAQEALDFYRKFALTDWETYTWDETKNNALDAFVNGDSAYFIGYHYHLEDIKTLAPNLNFDIAELPQISQDNKKNYANYWVESVALNTSSPDISWAFVQFLTNETNTTAYLEKAKKPAARRNLINGQMSDYELAIFAEQALTSKNWYHGKDFNETKNLFSQMIENALAQNFELEEIIRTTSNKVELTY